MCCVYGSGFCQCSNHCCTGSHHCWNLTLSADLMGFRVLCHRIDLTNGSSLTGSENDGASGGNFLVRPHGVSGRGDCGGVKNFSSTSVDSCPGFFRSSANVLRN